MTTTEILGVAVFAAVFLGAGVVLMILDGAIERGQREKLEGADIDGTAEDPRTDRQARSVATTGRTARVAKRRARRKHGR